VKKLLLTLLLTSASLWGNPNEMRLVPFNKAYEVETAKIYRENFPNYRDTFSSALLQNYSIKIGLLDKKVMGLIIYSDTTANGMHERYIARLAIDKPYQRANRPSTNNRHYGTELMKLFEKQSCKEGIHIVRLDAAGDNNIATINNICFYTNLNFKSKSYPHMAPLQAYARLGIQGLPMIKELEPQPSCRTGLCATMSSLKHCFKLSCCKSSNQVTPL
jgi:ribosomal protein S18 acetylase RimI-like enzyme